MINFEINGNKGKFTLNIPTNLNEITVDYLKEITKNVQIADNYSLVALVHREKLSNIILAARQKKNEINTSVIPIFIKCGNTDNEFYKNIEIKDKLIVAGSDLAMGNHVNVRGNIMTPELIMEYVEGDGFAYQKGLKHTEVCYFLQFKLIPNCNIRGYYSSEIETDYQNVFITPIVNTEGV